MGAAEPKCYQCGKTWASNVSSTKGCPFCGSLGIDKPSAVDTFVGLKNDFAIRGVGVHGDNVTLDLGWPSNPMAMFHVPLQAFVHRQLREKAGKLGLKVADLNGYVISFDRDSSGAMIVTKLEPNRYSKAV